MANALALGRRGLGRCWPNPSVGCVIVKDGRVVGRARTGDGGRPHAEALALDAAGSRAKGSTVYVSLEPCAHEGKTPPCAEALVAAGVARVVAPMADPDPRVAGRGFSILRDAGIAVSAGALAREAARANAGFLARSTLGRPFVTLKLASSIDGRIATGSGESKWITGPRARREAHAMRARHDAVMVGAGTAQADDPDLSARGLGIDRAPVRIVVSSRLGFPASGRLAKAASGDPVWICHGPEIDPESARAWERAGARLLDCDAACEAAREAARDDARDDAREASGSRVDPKSLMRRLGEEGLTSVLCEGGGELAASLLSAGVVDEVVAFGAGLAIGAEGRPSLGSLGLERLADGPRLDLVEARQVGGDVMATWRHPETSAWLDALAEDCGTVAER